MLSTTSKVDTSNKKWITKEKFKEVYPKGYRECNFFSSPVEFWSMSKEACLNWKKTALLDLSSKLNFQKNLQQTFIIGNSSDTELFTELLNLNNKVSKTDFTNKNTTTDNNLNTTDTIDTDDLLKKITNIKKCYTCNNVCKCSRLLSNRLKNSLKLRNNKKVALLSKAQVAFPDIQLIDQFDKSSIKSSIKSSLQKNKFKLSNFILNNNDVSVTNITQPKISENGCIFQNESKMELEKKNYDNYLTSPQEVADNIKSRSTTPIENEVIDIESASTQIIQDESTIDENNEYNNDLLKYFHLNSISDIFQNLYTDDIMDEL